MIWLAYSAFIVLIVRMGIVLFNIFTRQWLKKVEMQGEPLVSILIPARNEENTLPHLLADLTGHDYRNIEVIVYDDLSEDRTAEVAGAIAAKDPRFRVIEGEALPEGWLGKNHACHQLAQSAKGAYFLFLDSDVRVRDGLVQRSLGHLLKHDLNMLSIFPRQLMYTFGEKITVPLINWVLVSLLPLRLIRISKRSCFSAANGQFILFDAAVYMKYRFHEMVRDRRVEDIHIVRKMKQMDLKVHTLLSSGEVECRMYSGFGEAVSGLSRSVEEFFCGSRIFLFLFTLYSTFGFLFVLLGLSPLWMVVYLAQTWLLRMLVAYSGRQSLAWNAILQPLQQFSYVLIVIESLRKRYTNSFKWKGRVVHTTKK